MKMSLRRGEGVGGSKKPQNTLSEVEFNQINFPIRVL